MDAIYIYMHLAPCMSCKSIIIFKKCVIKFKDGSLQHLLVIRNSIVTELKLVCRYTVTEIRVYTLNFHVHILESRISESKEHEYAVTSIKKSLHTMLSVKC